MTASEQREAARQFYYTWRDRGDEKSDSQSYWLNLLTDVLGMDDTANRVVFEKRVLVNGQTKFIDVLIPESRVLIEQKSMKKDLSKPIPQSGGGMLTPYQQAKNYSDNLPFDEKPRWIVVSNFAEIRIHDMNSREPDKEYVSIMLRDLQSEYHRLKFLIKEETQIASKEEDISINAGIIVGQIYDALLEQYVDKTSPESLKSLNKLCVRLVFCMYAEDSDLFGAPMMFHDYLSQYDARSWRNALINLFQVLDTKPADRDPYLEDDLTAFPYVNGGLFTDDKIEIPRITDKIRTLILENGCGFDWSEISPTIFGAVFESTLNPETRRSGGMHYTSIENIHKVIDPLFLDALKEELQGIQSIGVTRQRKEKARKFQEKLSSLTFLDPACGSGNFLTETYISLRTLENQAIMIQTDGQMSLGEVINPIKISIGQFYGIEINDFAVTVGKTALWIAEHQMMKKTSDLIHMQIEFLPLKAYANIVEGNALRMDWKNVVPPSILSYIMGNPPFVGYKLQNENQKKDLFPLFGNIKNIDYVAGWYMKAAQVIQNTTIKVAYVSTNSITQGEQVPAIWEPLYSNYDIHIDFAYRTFIWNSEASIKAHVHCVIIGFSSKDDEKANKYIFENSSKKEVAIINPYLVEANPIFIKKRNTPICNCEKMIYGSEPREGGFLILNEKERSELLQETPQMQPYIKRFVSSDDFINNKLRFCLWLKNADMNIIRKSKIVMERLKNCREFRIASKQKQAHAAAETPYLFSSPRQPASQYLLVPIISSENRRYVPIGYMDKDVIVSNACFSVPNASLYTFGIITSNIHMAWMRAVCGRLKSDYRYSNTIVYNNFPWPNPTEEQREKIEQSAQEILNARALFPNSSLADLYDSLTMPAELRTAHQNNDKFVMQAYGFSIRNSTEETCVAELMKMYQHLTPQESAL